MNHKTKLVRVKSTLAGHRTSQSANELIALLPMVALDGLTADALVCLCLGFDASFKLGQLAAHEAIVAKGFVCDGPNLFELVSRGNVSGLKGMPEELQISAKMAQSDNFGSK